MCFCYSGDVYVTMQITFLTRTCPPARFALYVYRVPSLTLDCNGVFAIKVFGNSFTVDTIFSRIFDNKEICGTIISVGISVFCQRKRQCNNDTNLNVDSIHVSVPRFNKDLACGICVLEYRRCKRASSCTVVRVFIENIVKKKNQGMLAKWQSKLCSKSIVIPTSGAKATEQLFYPLCLV